MKFHADEEDILPRFRNMVQKVVSDFDDKKQYVLWLVCDYFSAWSLYDVEGTVQLYDANNQEIDIMGFGLQNTKIITRTPYPNKLIRQIGIQKGRGKVFGIPLVFYNYQDMLQIKTIKIHWNIMKPIFFDENTVWNVRPITLDILYYLSFDITDIEAKHWFTLSHKTHLFNDYPEGITKITDYYDMTLCVSGYHIEDNDGIMFAEDTFCKICSANKMEWLLSNHERGVVHWLDQQIDCLTEMFYKYNRKYNEIVDDINLFECDADCYYYEKAVMLEASSSPDISPLSVFGFKSA